MTQTCSFSKNLLFSALFFKSIFLFSGCGMRFYKPIQIRQENFEEKINSALKIKRYFTIHRDEKHWHLANPMTFNENGQAYIKGTLKVVDSLEAEMSERLVKNDGTEKKFAYSPRFGKKNKATHQIQLYVADSLINVNQFSVPISLITKVVDYNTAPVRTLFSHFILIFVLPSTIISFIFR